VAELNCCKRFVEVDDPICEFGWDVDGWEEELGRAVDALGQTICRVLFANNIASVELNVVRGA
jgi:hypothetical protein